MKRVESTWDAKLYNGKYAFVYDHGESLIELLDPKAHEYILDLGCGTGQLTAKINEKAREVIGMDMSSEMIESARLNFPSLNFQIGDASEFHFDKNFDAIFSNAALHWVTNYKAVIKCMYANLKKGAG